MDEATRARAEAMYDAEMLEFAQQIADQVQSFLIALRAIARGDAPGGHAVSLLLLEVSQVLLAGGRLGVHEDFQPVEQYEPDAGPDPDLDELRLRLAVLLEGIDAFTEVFDPYVDPPELVSSLRLRRPDLDRGLTRARPAALQVRTGARGAVVVAVLLRQLLGRRGQRGAACAAVGRSRTTGSTRSSRASRRPWRQPSSFSTESRLRRKTSGFCRVCRVTHGEDLAVDRCSRVPLALRYPFGQAAARR